MLRLIACIVKPWRIRGLGNGLRHLIPAMQRGCTGSLLWNGEPVMTGPATAEHYRQLSVHLEQEAQQRWLHVAAGAWPAVHENVLAKSWQYKRWGTIQVDLTQTKDALLAATKGSARKALRRAERDGISVRRISSLEELRDYYDFACRCAKRYNKRMYGFEDYQSLWQHIRPRAYFETFVAEHDGEMIAGLSTWGQGDSIGELGSFQSERSFKKKLYGSDLLKWMVFQWGKEKGLRMFDLAGVNPSPEGKDVGIRQFKEKWGGTYYEYLVVG